MFKNILIVGCGLIGSSVLRGSINKKISKNVYVFEKLKKNITIIKKINKRIKFISNFDHQVSKMDLIILCTHMSEYKNIIKKLQRYITSKNIIIDTGSTKRNVEKLIQKNKKLNTVFFLTHPIFPPTLELSLILYKLAVFSKPFNSILSKIFFD